MKSIIRAAAVLVATLGISAAAYAGDAAEGTATIDKAIKAMGGTEKLASMKAVAVKVTGKISIGGEDSNFKMVNTIDGYDHARQEFEGDIGDNHIKAATVLAGDKAWRQTGDMVNPLEDDQVAGFRRNLYMQLVAFNPTLLKDSKFKVDSTTDEQVGGKPAIAVKIIGPDTKDFTISFDKESGLVVKSLGRVMNYMGSEVSQETLYADYKETDGIKKAMHITVNHDGEKLLDEQVTEFKVMDKADASTFAEPK